MEILNAFGGVRSEREKRLSIEFLKSFLTDPEVRDQKAGKLFEGPIAAMLHKKTAVRDFAAERLASVLDLKVDVDPTWKEADWQRLHKQVEAALAEFEKGKDKP